MKSFCVLIFVLSSELVVGQRSPLNDYHRSKGVQLHRPSYWAQEMPFSEEDCAIHCTRTLSCRAFNYNLQSKQCQMLDWTSQETGTERQRHNHVDLYEKKDYMRECIVNKGVTYRGYRYITKSGKMCQHWSTNVPHEHRNSPSQFPRKGLDLNYCRNPDNDENGPWCYTTDWHTRLEDCGIKRCDEGTLRRIWTIITAAIPMGHAVPGVIPLTLQWSANIATYGNVTLPQGETSSQGLEENYCRNPDGSEAPWCFTKDRGVRTAFCFQLERCNDDIEPEDCYTGNGTTYRGFVSKTRKGIPCQMWNTNSPHRPRVTPQTHPNAGLLKNYCRNPDGDSHGPWCYTSDPKVQWDYCAIRTCNGHAKATNKEDPASVEFESCGRREDRPVENKKSRMLRGTPGNSPWTVSLRNREGKHFCGGSLVRRNWIISMKQCFSSCYAEFRGYEALMGTILKDPRSDDPDKQAIPIRRAVCGPKHSNLIMLELERPATLNSRVALICLPPQGYIVPEGTSCEIAGWGETQGTGRDDVLNILVMPVISNKVCNLYYRGRLAETEICAGTVLRGFGACERDYGGPLACFTHSCWVLEGVIIPRRGCGRPNHPGIFVRVAMYVDWIKKVIEL
ncbi:hypothetical protein chiPu_0017166 [Chiloscyllium punctatum]|uniref:Hepatocyte growth factor n=1 Tax=Chiloscyllium punctatum TaxID=137246 RepID=A0A401T7K4_CHIPU|nr:hypothetical protein [Chiloscyllium punctatum]